MARELYQEDPYAGAVQAPYADRGWSPGQSQVDPVALAMLKATQALEKLALPNASQSPIHYTEVGTRQPIQVEFTGAGAEFFRPSSGFTFGDFMPPNVGRSDTDAITARGFVYDVSGTFNQAYFWTQDGPVMIPIEALEFRPTSNGAGPVRTALEGIKAGDFPYIKAIPGVVVPPMENVIQVTFVYIPKVIAAPSMVVDGYQAPYVSNTLYPPVGKDNAAVLDFGFAAQVPTVTVVDATTGTPTSVVYYEIIPYQSGAQTLTHSLIFWTDVSDVQIPVRFKVQQ